MRPNEICPPLTHAASWARTIRALIVPDARSADAVHQNASPSGGAMSAGPAEQTGRPSRQSASFRPVPSWYQSGKPVRGLTGPTALSEAPAGAASAPAATAASAVRVAIFSDLRPPGFRPAVLGERMLNTELPPEELWTSRLESIL